MEGMFDKNSVICTGGSGLVFTDENGKSFLVDSQKLSLGVNERVLFSKGIKRFCCNKELTDKERKMIISKVLDLTPDIKWLIQ